MKLSLFLVFVAFLLGVAIFGFYKSLELVQENEDIKLSVTELELKLDTSHKLLKDSRTSLSDMVKKNAGLQGEILDLNQKLEQRSGEIQGYLQELAVLAESFNQSVQANTELMGQSDSLTQEKMRLELENLEMKKRLSSVPELKRAITEVRVREREERIRQREERVREAARLREQRASGARDEEPAPSDEGGNAGYFVRDGKDIDEKVDIRVIPVSEDPEGPPRP